jgi:hypothetical protein
VPIGGFYAGQTYSAGEPKYTTYIAKSGGAAAVATGGAARATVISKTGGAAATCSAAGDRQATVS